MHRIRILFLIYFASFFFVLKKKFFLTEIFLVEISKTFSHKFWKTRSLLSSLCEMRGKKYEKRFFMKKQKQISSVCGTILQACMQCIQMNSLSERIRVFVSLLFYSSECEAISSNHILFSYFASFNDYSLFYLF